MQAILPRTFFDRDSRVVAIELLGKELWVQDKNTCLAGRIVEVEAYCGTHDPASHAAQKKTKRNEVMFGTPGIAYVYVIYGMYHCVNVVTEKEGVPGSVFIRAVEPLSGIEKMSKRRLEKSVVNLTNGPGKLAQAFGLTKKHTGTDITQGAITIRQAKKEASRTWVQAAQRIGIMNGADLLYRYYIRGNRFVSKLL